MLRMEGHTVYSPILSTEERIGNSLYDYLLNLVSAGAFLKSPRTRRSSVQFFSEVLFFVTLVASVTMMYLTCQSE